MKIRTWAAAALSAALLLSACGEDESAAAQTETTPAFTLPPASSGSSIIDERDDDEPPAVTTTVSAAPEDKHELKQPAAVPAEYYAGETGQLLYNTAPIVNAYKTGDRTGLDDMQNAILDKAQEIIWECIGDDMTDYEKELAIHDYIVINCTYDQGSRAVIPKPAENSDDPHGALVDGVAICTGYTTAFRMFMDMLDIPCETVYNKDDKHNHAYNIVTIDGAKYYVDVTWDDPVPDKNRQLTPHRYFNVSRRDLEADHVLPAEAPETPVLKDTYASHKLSPEPADEAALRELLQEALDDYRNTIYFIPEEGSRWSTGVTENDGKLAISDNELLRSVYRVFSSFGCTYTKVISMDTDKGAALCLLFSKTIPEQE